MADDAPKLSSVDESPISPIERRNSLEKHLQMRPDAKDLKDRHILLDTNAAPYVILHTRLQKNPQLTLPSTGHSSQQLKS